MIMTCWCHPKCGQRCIMVNTDSSPLSHHRPDLPVGNPLSVISTTINPLSRMILESHLFLPTPPHIPHTINYQAQPIPPLKYLFNPSSLQSLQTSPWSDSFCNSLMGLYASKVAVKLHVSDRWIFSISNLIVPCLKLFSERPHVLWFQKQIGSCLGLGGLGEMGSDS